MEDLSISESTKRFNFYIFYWFFVFF